MRVAQLKVLEQLSDFLLIRTKLFMKHVTLLLLVQMMFELVFEARFLKFYVITKITLLKNALRNYLQGCCIASEVCNSF